MGRFSRLENAAPLRVTVEPSAAQRAGQEQLAEAESALLAGRPHAALRACMAAREHAAELADLWELQAWAQLDLGRALEAKASANQGLKLQPEDSDLLAAMACACLRSGDQQQAQAFSDAAISARNSGFRAWLVRGEIALECGFEHWVYALTKAGTMGRSWFARISVARVLLAYRRPTEALEWALQATTAEPKAVLGWRVQGECHEQLGMDDEATVDFQRALVLDPTCTEAMDGLARMARRPWWKRLYLRIVGNVANRER